MSETELLQAFRENRSEEAFAELVRRYAGLVYSVARRRLTDAKLAEDITQIVFIRFAQTPPRVRSHGELAAWLHRTTVNVTIDTWRSETRRRAREQKAVTMEPAGSETAVWEDISPKLDEALNQLTDDDRQALLLRFFGRKSMRDVGAALGVSEDAAKMRVSRAVDRLRTQLGGGGAACSAAGLGTILAEHSVEAAPGQLVSQLLKIKLPAAAGVAGVGGLSGLLLRLSKWKLAGGAVVLVIMGIGTIYLARSLKPAAPGMVAANHRAAPATRAAPDRFGSLPSVPGLSSDPKPARVKMWLHVVDAENGQPLPGVQIRSAYFGTGGLGEGHDGLTDSNGTIAIPEPDDLTRYPCPNIFVVAEGHVPRVLSFGNVPMPADYTMKLDPAMTVGGTIVDDEGRAVGGVKILVQGPGNRPGQIENVDFQLCPVTSREDGSWSCGYVPQDRTNEIHFVLKKEGYAVTFPMVPTDQGDLQRLVLVINRGFTITGQVTGPQEYPVAVAQINVINGDPNKRQTTTTDAGGFFTLTGVMGDVASNAFYLEPPVETKDNGSMVIHGITSQGPLHAILAVQAGGLAAQSRTVELSAPTNIANFTLSPGNRFRGRVVDEDGNPISNAVVQTDYDFKNQVEKSFDWTIHTGADGRFEWDSAPAGKVCYWFDADGYKWIRGIPLVADGSDQEIILKRAAGQ